MSNKLLANIHGGILPNGGKSTPEEIEETIRGLTGDSELIFEHNEMLSVKGLTREGADSLRNVFGPFVEIIGMYLGYYVEDKGWVFTPKPYTVEEWKISAKRRGKLMHWYPEDDMVIYRFQPPDSEKMYIAVKPAY